MDSVEVEGFRILAPVDRLTIWAVTVTIPAALIEGTNATKCSLRRMVRTTSLLMH